MKDLALINVALILLLALFVLALTGCGLTQEGDLLRATVRDKGATAYDEALVNLEWALCEAASVGSIRRRYGADPKRAAAYATICSPVMALP